MQRLSSLVTAFVLLPTCLLGLLACTSGVAYGQQQIRYIKQFRLEGLVLGYEKDPKKGFLKKRQAVIIEGALPNVQVNVYSDGQLFKKTATDAQGTFKLMLRYDALYQIDIAREGYNQTRLLLDTRAIPEHLRRRGIRYSGLEFILNRFKDGKDSDLNEQLGRIFYNPEKEAFDLEVYGDRSVPKNEQDTPVELLRRAVERNTNPLPLFTYRASLPDESVPGILTTDSLLLDSLLAVVIAETRRESDLTISQDFNPEVFFGQDSLLAADLETREAKLNDARFWYSIDQLRAKTYQDSVELVRRAQLIAIGERELLRSQELLLLEEEKTEAQADSIYRLVGLLLLFLLFSLLLGFFYKDKTRINELLRRRNKQITDSINYASRIQEAVLASETDLQAIYPASFVYNNPKAIVSGDFFWLQPLPTGFRLAVADCTGHGVPGAFMSLIGQQLLDEVGREQPTGPAMLLDELHRRMIRTLDQKDESSQQDGIELSLIEVDLDQQLIRFAGAVSPLWLVTNGKVRSIKGSPRSIGGLLSRKDYEPAPFGEETISIQPGMTCYLFTDGLLDQFGGENGDKLNARRLRDWLGKAANLAVTEQEPYLRDKMKTWQASWIQPDDQLLVGLVF